MASMLAVGIDLGTTYSCVAAWYNGRIRIIQNEQGNTTTPSLVAYTTEKRLIGDAAKNQVAANVSNTVYDSKRLIGRRFDDPLVQQDLKNWSFKVVDDGNNNPKIQVEYLNETHFFTPEEISATILTNIKHTAERFLRQPVVDVVVTVPAYFNNSQRQATKDAGAIAGLNVLQIINEPTAAALAYGLEKKVQGTQIVLIYDLGGGTFDVSIIKIINGEQFEVKAVAGNNHLGGEDFDDLLVQHFANEFKRQHNLDLRGNARGLCKLRTACERAKRTLSVATETSIELECLFEGQDFCATITRSRFELLCDALFQQTIQLVRQALNDSEYAKGAIDEVVMVGGSTRIPKIQELVSEFFDQKALNHSMNPDEAVAYGAAVHAAKLADINCCEVQNVKLLDVVPLSLGTEVDSGEMVTVIPKNSRIPCEFTKVFYKIYDRQTEALISIHEGERPMAADNNLLAELVLTDISQGQSNSIKIDVTFILNTDGILTARAQERNKANTREIAVNIKNGRLTKIDVDRMLVQAIKHERIDKEAENQTKSTRNSLVHYIKRCEEAIVDDSLSLQLSELDKQQVQERCAQDTKWLDDNENVEKSVLEVRLRDLKRFIDTFAWNFNKNKLT